MTSLADKLAAHAVDTSAHLAKVGLGVATRLSLERERTDLAERLASVNRDIRALERETLPNLFAEAGVDAFTLAASGNQPATTARLAPYCRASISSEWPAERRDAAFAALERAGLGDLVKNVVVVTLDRGDAAGLSELREYLTGRYAFEVSRSVAWNTLTAAVRDLIDRDAAPTEFLSAIGADVGRVVTIKPKKE